MRTTQLSSQASQRVLTIQPYGAGVVPKGYDEQVAQATTPQSVIADAHLATAELYEVATPKPDGSPIFPRARGWTLCILSLRAVIKRTSQRLVASTLQEAHLTKRPSFSPSRQPLLTLNCL